MTTMTKTTDSAFAVNTLTNTTEYTPNKPSQRQDKFYDNMPEDELERLLTASITDQKARQVERAPATSTTSPSATSSKTTSPTASRTLSDKVTNLHPQAVNATPAPQIQNQSQNQLATNNIEPKSMPNALTNSTDIDLTQSAEDIEQTIWQIKQQLKRIADESAVFAGLTTQLITQVRQLQQMGEDDFSVTYEQIYQFRSCLFETKRCFSEVPNFLDMVEHAWDNDIFTAQTRHKSMTGNYKN